MTTGYKVKQPGGGDHYHSDHSIYGGHGGHYHSGHCLHSGHCGHDDPDEQSLHGGYGGRDVQFRSIFTFIECFQRLRAW